MGLKTTTKVWFGIITVILAISATFTVIGFVGGWGKAAVDIVSVDNVKAQHEQVIGKYNSMIVAAQNACDVTKADTKQSTDKSPVLIEGPSLAYASTFRNTAAAYVSSLENLFKAKLTAPAGYPTAEQINALDTSDWCTVAGDLKALRQ